MTAGGATRRLLGVLLGAVLCIAATASPAAGYFLSPFARDAIDYLKTRGLLPLWAGGTRPILPWDLKAALETIDVAQLSSLSAPDLAALRLLDPEFGPAGPSFDTENDASEALVRAPYGVPRTYATLSVATGSSLERVGWAADGHTATFATQASGTSWLGGRTPFAWGPVPPGAELLLNESAGGLDALQISFVWNRVRFSKIVGWLDAGRSIVATRMDIPYRPNLRLGFSESIIMDGAPYLPYVLNPVPIGINPGLMAHFRMPQIVDNFFLSAEVEWVPKPGLRYFGELLIDDITVPTSTADFPSKWGLTAGVHAVSEDGSGLQAFYTIMLNWVYSDRPQYHYMMRGLPIGHTLGNDFDLIHIRWTPLAPPVSSVWVAYVRKGEGKVGVFWTSQQEAWQKLWLSGVVEYSLLAGFDAPFSASGWTGTVGPWVAYRTNADHIAGATRVDWGLNIEAQWSF